MEKAEARNAEEELGAIALKIISAIKKVDDIPEIQIDNRNERIAKKIVMIVKELRSYASLREAQAVEENKTLRVALKRIVDSWDNSFDVKYEPWHSANELLNKLEPPDHENR